MTGQRDRYRFAVRQPLVELGLVLSDYAFLLVGKATWRNDSKKRVAEVLKVRPSPLRNLCRTDVHARKSSFMIAG